MLHQCLGSLGCIVVYDSPRGETGAHTDAVHTYSSSGQYIHTAVVDSSVYGRSFIWIHIID